MTNTPGDEAQDREPERPTGAPGDRPSGQPGYWEQQAHAQPPYAQGPPGYPAHAPIQYAPDHPRATTSLVLGILGIVPCQLLAPVAWWVGKKTLDEIDASHGMLGGRTAAQAGYIMGIVGTVLLALGLAFFLIYLLVIVAVVGGGIATS